MSVLTGEWRVLGGKRDGSQLLVRPLEGQELPEPEAVDGLLVVDTTGYGGDLQGAVDSVRVGNRIAASIYPADRSRFVEVSVVDEFALRIGRDSTAAPSVATALWREATAGHEGDGPVAATSSLDVDGTVAELHVVQSTVRVENDAWWAFLGGRTDDATLARFAAVEGTPAEAIAANPEGVPFYYVVTFGARGTDAAEEWATKTGVAASQRRDLSELVASLPEGARILGA